MQVRIFVSGVGVSRPTSRSFPRCIVQARCRKITSAGVDDSKLAWFQCVCLLHCHHLFTAKEALT
jgi:hypothetical protein